MEYLSKIDIVTDRRLGIIPHYQEPDNTDINTFLGVPDAERQMAIQLEAIAQKLLIRGELKLKGSLPDKLKKVAENYFQQFNEYEQKRLEGNATLGVHADWKGYIIKYRGFNFKLKNLLLGFGNTDDMPADKISRVVLYLLNRSQADKHFLGWWKAGSLCEQMLDSYQIDKARYNKKRRAIDLKALDTILEILQLNEDQIAPTNFQVPHLRKNRLYKLNMLPKGDDAQKIFSDKLVGRRVLLTICKLFEYQPEYSLTQIATVLTHDMDSTIRDVNDLTTKTIRYYLGLRRKDRKVALHRNYIMNEELEFLSSFTSYILPLKRFLTDYTPSTDLLNDIDYNYEGTFHDISSFNHFITACDTLLPAHYSDIMLDIRKFIKTDKRYNGVDTVLSWSNPLF